MTEAPQTLQGWLNRPQIRHVNLTAPLKASWPATIGLLPGVLLDIPVNLVLEKEGNIFLKGLGFPHTIWTGTWERMTETFASCSEGLNVLLHVSPILWPEQWHRK